MPKPEQNCKYFIKTKLLKEISARMNKIEKEIR